MAHVIEPASSARSKCRGCGERIAAGELRFGESVPNPFGEGEAMHWFHVDCATLRRPEPLLEALAERTEPLADSARLIAEARFGVAHPRLARLNGAERSPSARAQCRACHTAIEKGAWRVVLIFYEEGRFMPGGFVHARCAKTYFETPELGSRLRRFSPALTEEDWKDLQLELERESPGAAPEPPPS
jgi:Poly(ADP-ribose) polymerase and DNA-Ligase Zn-finger region